MKHNLLPIALLFAGPIFLNGQIAGIPDSTFGQGGQVVVELADKSYYGGTSVLLPDGKILVAGSEYDQNTDMEVPFVARLLPDGSPDATYGDNGRVYPEIYAGADADVAKITLTAEGKLLAVGALNGGMFESAYVMRLNADGSLDTSFGQNGSVIYSLGGSDYNLTAMLVKPDGKILTGGYIYETGVAGAYNLLLVQLLANGLPDNSFGTGGKATADFSPEFESVISLALQADGKIIAAGGSATDSYDMEVVRFNLNGSVDESFAANGVFTFSIDGHDDVAFSVAVQNDQKIIFSGTSFENGSTSGELTVFRLLPDGSYDPDFGVSGQVFTEAGVFEFGRSLIIQPDQKIIVGAENIENAFSTAGPLRLLRYLPDGSLDPSFGDNGQTQTPVYPESPEAIDLLLQPDGKIIQTGTTSGKIVVWRYLNDLIVATKDLQTVDFQLQCSPNPVTEQAELSWTQLSGKARCDVYDMQGKFLQTLLPPTFFPAGQQRQNVFLKNTLPAGTYFLQLRVGNQQQVVRVVKK